MTLRRAAIIIVLIAAALVLLAWPDAHADYLGSDPFQNLTGSEAHGLMGRYPLSAYQLDNHIDSSTLPGSSWVEEVAAGMAQLIWWVTSFLVKLTISFVTLAFSLNVFSGHGPFRPIAQATQHLHRDVLGNAPMLTMLILLGLWGVKKAVWDQRHTEAAGQLALSFIYVFVALTLLIQPVPIFGATANWVNQATTALLTGTNAGSLHDPQATKNQIADELWRAEGLYPWTVLEFGGLRHCVDQTHLNDSGFPTPVAENSPDRTACRDHLRVINGHGGYAWRFLRQPYKSDARGLEFEALKNGEVPGGPLAKKQMAGYNVDKADSPAVDIQQLGGGFTRLGMSVAIAVCAGLFCWLFGLIALAIILTGVLAMFLFAFAPIALFAAVLPGRGHGIFEGWGLHLIAFLFVKMAFAILITALITVTIAMTSALGSEGWVFAYGLLAAFYGAVWFYRSALMRMLGGRNSRREERTIRSTTEKTFAVTAAAVATPYVAARGLMHGRQEHTPADDQEQAPATPTDDLREVERQPPSAEERSQADYQQRWSGSRVRQATIPEAQPDHPATPTASRKDSAEPVVSESVVPPVVAGLPPLPPPHQPPEPELPGVNTPDSVVGPQQREQRQEQEQQDQTPHVPEAAPAPEYRGPE